jgi:hypothetical protein
MTEAESQGLAAIANRSPEPTPDTLASEIEEVTGSLTDSDEGTTLHLKVEDWNGYFTPDIKSVAPTSGHHVITLTHDDGLYRLVVPSVGHESDEVPRLEFMRGNTWEPLTNVTDVEHRA